MLLLTSKDKNKKWLNNICNYWYSWNDSLFGRVTDFKSDHLLIRNYYLKNDCKITC